MPDSNHSTDRVPSGSLPIPGYDRYRICDGGCVWTNLPEHGRRERRWSQSVPWRRVKSSIGRGYVNVSLMVPQGISQKRGVHTLVLATFVGPCPPGMEACHKDGFRANNFRYNLRWDTHENNIDDKLVHGTGARGQNSGTSKLTEEQIVEIFRLAKADVPRLEITKKYGITNTNLSRILRRQSWKHVPIDPELLNLPLGRPVGDRASLSKIKSADVLEIFRLRKDGLTHSEIADRYGIVPANVSAILCRRSWKSVAIPSDLLPH